MKNLKKKSTILFLSLILIGCCEIKVDYKDPNQSVDDRVESLLSQMTLE